MGSLCWELYAVVVCISFLAFDTVIFILELLDWRDRAWLKKTDHSFNLNQSIRESWLFMYLSHSCFIKLICAILIYFILKFQSYFFVHCMNLLLVFIIKAICLTYMTLKGLIYSLLVYTHDFWYVPVWETFFKDSWRIVSIIFVPSLYKIRKFAENIMTIE